MLWRKLVICCNIIIVTWATLLTNCFIKVTWEGKKCFFLRRVDSYSSFMKGYHPSVVTGSSVHIPGKAYKGLAFQMYCVPVADLIELGTSVALYYYLFHYSAVPWCSYGAHQ